MENFTKQIKPRGTDEAKIILIIETRSLRGIGTEEDPCRCVSQYWSLNGDLLAENDPLKEKE